MESSTSLTSAVAPSDPATSGLRPLELVCPAGSLPALKAAVDNGASCVYLGLRDATNARNFAGLNFDEVAIATGLRYAHQRHCKVFMALNTYPQASKPEPWRTALDKAVDLGVDAVILADPGLMQYAALQHPQLRLHLSVQGSATNHDAINFYREQFGVVRAVLPRVLSLAQVQQVVEKTPVEIEVFGFGSLCVMVEGRCALSSYVTGESPNTHGVCSPAKAVRWQETPKGLESRLNGVLIDRYAEGESAGYPTLCKGRFEVGSEESYYAIEEPTSLNTLELLPQLMKIGVRAIKIEGRQRSPAYVGQVTRVWREAIDNCVGNPHRYSPKATWMSSLDKVAEGQQHTLGAYHRPWK
ncbi:MAG: U32 family peptidase [Polaromonas sp.]|uniref:ubiquinone anaerobic biosynthesis protein UbiU n=1 Tax=Polaromonas sp. TaxID=1869339 RepID=UPI0017A244FB|nr:peptidase U32 family protein [Polaromonas sp.]NMM09108.1 U32 family peptidase [Polaromonas sp.]